MKKYIIIIFTIIYLLGYIEIRRNHLLVHNSGFISNHDGVKLTYGHNISPGSSVGLLQPRLFYASFFVHLIYRPLTVVEERYWYMVVPQDDVWPYTLHTTL